MGNEVVRRLAVSSIVWLGAWRCISLLYLIALRCRKAGVKLLDHLWLRDHRLSDDVDELAKVNSGFRSVAEINLARMNRLVSDHADYVETLLNCRIKALLHQGFDVSVNVLARFPEVFAKLLNT